eukprot:2870678-Pleurochrysis_carterae.AAC.1
MGAFRCAPCPRSFNAPASMQTRQRDGEVCKYGMCAWVAGRRLNYCGGLAYVSTCGWSTCGRVGGCVLRAVECSVVRACVRAYAFPFHQPLALSASCSRSLASLAYWILGSKGYERNTERLISACVVE